MIADSTRAKNAFAPYKLIERRCQRKPIAARNANPAVNDLSESKGAPLAQLAAAQRG
jgi:hypothetical protein